MARTIRRQPFSVSTSNNDYPKEQVFNQINFKGLYDGKNDIAADASTFSNSKNMYVDENNLLISRAPFKISDEEGYIIRQWTFGEYTIRFQRLLVNENEEKVDDPLQYTQEQLSYVFMLRCISHETIDLQDENVFGSFGWKFSVVDVGMNFEPAIMPAHIEDKVFFWFGGVSLIVFNMSGYSKNGTHLPYFEDGQKYLYIPIKELVVNGFESDLEDENFLTKSYRKRYQYSAVSSVNFDSLIGEELSINLSSNTIDKSRHLYDIFVKKNSSKILLFPYSVIGENYHVDVVQTPRSTVVLRFGLRSKHIEISFDARYFRSIPYLDGILGVPQFTKDALYLIAFTKTAVMKYKLVAQESSDFTENSGEEWVGFNYAQNAVYNYQYANVAEIDTTFVPTGYFQTADQFCYVFQGSDLFDITGTKKFIYVEWLHTDGVYAAVNSYSNDFSTDELKVTFKYVSADLTVNTGAIVSILGLGKEGNTLDSIAFEGIADSRKNRELYNGDAIVDNNGTRTYVYKLTSDLKNIVDDYVPILSGDNVILSHYKENDPWTHSFYDDENSTMRYRSSTRREQILCSNNTVRCVIRNRSGAERIRLGDNITIEPIEINMTYTGFDRAAIYGVTDASALAAFFAYYDDAGNSLLFPPHSVFLTVTVSQKGGGEVEIAFRLAKATPNVQDIKGLSTSPIRDQYHHHTILARDADIVIDVPEWSSNKIEFAVKTAFNVYDEDSEKLNEKYIDNLLSHTFVMDRISTNDSITEKSILNYFSRSRYFKFDPETHDLITDNYLYSDKEVVELPESLRNTSYVTDRSLLNRDRIVLSSVVGVHYRNMYVHRLTDDAINLSMDDIYSGDVVSLSTQDDDFSYLRKETKFGNRWYIERLGADENANWKVLSGPIEPGDIVRFRAYDKEVILPSDNVGNDTGSDVLISPIEWPLPPDGWEIGHEWPEEWPWLPPWILESDHTVRTWLPGDPLPIGPVELYGLINIEKSVLPISLSNTGAWYLIDRQLWTSQLTDDVVLHFDEYVNCNNKEAIVNREIPDHFETLDEHYFSFKGMNGKYLLEVTSSRYDEDLSEKNDFLLYLPKSNEQTFPQKITNLCPLSENTIGIFTENSVWYMSSTVNENTLIYVKPIKSKIPIGCRDGDEITIALDGQALIIPTKRGIAAMRPEVLMSDTDQTLSYLSDAILDRYMHFYNDGVRNASLIPDEFDLLYKPFIRINTYKYWILFHKYFDREILMFDTRNGSWWSITTPYPIRQIDVGIRLNVIMQVDYSPMKNGAIVFPTSPASLLGVSFVLADIETQPVFKENGFPLLDDDILKYKDDIIPNTLNGVSELKYENKFVGYRRILHYASPIIDWYFTSQRLHFGQTGNFKNIKSINLNLKGTKTITAKFSTKVFRDFYHPEQSNVMEMQINDVRTFIKHLNLMHVIDFQYKLENDTDAESSQFRLNGIGIKYEVKEKIR